MNIDIGLYQRVPVNPETIDEQYALALKARDACITCLPGEPEEIGERGYHVSEMREMPYGKGRGRGHRYAVAFIVSYDERPGTGPFRIRSAGSITVAALEDLTLAVMERKGDVDEVIECIEKA